jgi:hypothetical protein
VTDFAILRFPKAVTHFSPGSYPNRPFQSCSIPNVFLAGDWVKGVPHGANGLSQERAYVTGLTAANLVVDRLGRGGYRRGCGAAAGWLAEACSVQHWGPRSCRLRQLLCSVTGRVGEPRFGLGAQSASAALPTAGNRAVVLDVEPDEPHVAAGRQVVRAAKDVMAGLGLRGPGL